jgi:hypothetical protein
MMIDFCLLKIEINISLVNILRLMMSDAPVQLKKKEQITKNKSKVNKGKYRITNISEK